jgi:hypothetical protein
MICPSCNLPIDDEQDTACGMGGLIHRSCFKRGTTHGETIDLLSLLDKIEALQKRVQDLERKVADASGEIRREIRRMNWHAWTKK